MPSISIESKFILVTLIIPCILVYLILNNITLKQSLDNSSNGHLNYIFAAKSNHKFTTNPLSSDHVYNQALIDHVVGTLIRYQKNGRYENYLLNSWSTTADQKTWTFVLRKGLKTERNTLINSKNYIDGIKKVLCMYYSTFGDDLIFKNVRGYNNFIHGKTENIEGLKILSEFSFEITFLKKPDRLIENLSLPYYGFFSEKNFNNSCEWKSNTSIDSSGPYKLTSLSQDYKRAQLTKRSQWPLNKEQFSPRVVDIFFHHSNLTKLPKNVHNIVYTNISNRKQIPSNYVYIKGTPVHLFVISLSPSSEIFSKTEYRRSFKKHLNNFLNKQKYLDLASNSTSKFFPSLKTFDIRFDFINELPKRKVLIYNPLHNSTSSKSKYINNALASVLENMNLNAEYVKANETAPSNSLKILRESELYDIRVTGFITDYELRTSMIEMMFCSRMGVSLNDPSGEICSQLNNLQDGLISRQEYLKKFENSLENDSSVLPVLRSAPVWIYSKGVIESSISPVTVTPRFDQIILSF